tara:strand:+ start:342 stop:614 length:273 start_codon:yes stop_codon:yes gene_type:complete
MTKKQIKEKEEYLSNQSRILNDSLDFWQLKTLEQVSWLEELDEDSDEPTEEQQQAQKELDYCMSKLQWDNIELAKLDKEIKFFLKSKKSK